MYPPILRNFKIVPNHFLNMDVMTDKASQHTTLTQCWLHSHPRYLTFAQRWANMKPKWRSSTKGTNTSCFWSLADHVLVDHPRGHSLNPTPWFSTPPSITTTSTTPHNPANTRRWTIVVLMLGQRRRRWANNKPTLVQGVVFAGHATHWLHWSPQGITGDTDIAGIGKTQ